MKGPEDDTKDHPHGIPPSLTPITDARAPQTVEWSQMSPAARAAACKAALVLNVPDFQACEKRWNPETGLAFAIKEHPYDAQRIVYHAEMTTTVDQALAEIRSRFGAVADTIAQLVNPKPPAWQFWRKR